ncbi:MAG TPA: hypothetical protein VE733_21915, partial [Streptosporangiaceae bacterium]|nr:hypothetical protein [Streptosporangiaceae bacterium]
MTGERDTPRPNLGTVAPGGQGPATPGCAEGPDMNRPGGSPADARVPGSESRGGRGPSQQSPPQRAADERAAGERAAGARAADERAADE